MKTLVTGVAGFVGSTLADRLLRDGHEVTGIDALTDYYDTRLKHANLQRLTKAGFEFIRGDLNELDLGIHLEDVEVVFHQAGQPGVRKSWGTDFEVYSRQNVDGTQSLLEAAASSTSLKRFVYASSSSVYGDADRYPTQETDRPQPMSPYGVTKLAAEHLCVLYAKNFGVPTTSLRYFTVYGPRQRPDMAFTRFTLAAVRDEPITVFGDGGQIRDFTYVDDIVEANVRAAQSQDLQAGGVYNVAGGSNVSLAEVIDTLSELNGRAVRVQHAPAVPGDVRRTGGSIERISTDLRWTPKVSLRDGLAAQLDWARSASR